MKVLKKPLRRTAIRDWQGWLAQYQKRACVEGWYEHIQQVDHTQIPPWQWAAMYPMLLETDICNAMLLACLQAPRDKVPATLESIAAQVHTIRLEKPGRSWSREIKELYRESSRQLMRWLPPIADLYCAVFNYYIHDQAVAADINLLMREAQALCAMKQARQRERTLALLGQVGVGVLQGQRLWHGWSDEGSEEFRTWALALTGIAESCQPIIPLKSFAAERARANEIAATLSPQRFNAQQNHANTPQAELIPDVIGKDPEQFIEEWTKILERAEPLSDAEIAAMGDHYQALCESATISLCDAEHNPMLPPEQLPEIISVAISMVGLLRCANPMVVNKLIDIISDDSGQYTADVDDAVWALSQLGAVAIQPCLDFVRYSSRDYARDDILAVLGEIGRGATEVYDYLSEQFQASDRSEFAYPLALLHDQRAVPLLVAALRDPTIDDEEAWELLDALEELAVDFEYHGEKHSVKIPGYGVVENVLPLGWTPRAEREKQWAATRAEIEEELENWEGKSDSDEVYFDEKGVARCPDCHIELQWINGRWVHPPAPPLRSPLPSLSRLGPLPPLNKPISAEKVGRNDPCPCGSGKKYKHCHGRTLAIN